jgi:hypothetical protein
MNRMRRRLLKLLLLWPFTLAASRVLVDEEFVIVDGWVMKRTDFESRHAR